MTIALTLQKGPPVLAVERLTVSGAVLRLAEGVPAGRWVVADLQVGQGVSTPAKVAWSQQVAPGLPLTLAGLEFVGTWEALGTLRRAILGVVGSRALDGDAHVGFVVAEPGGTYTCYSAESVTLAVISPDGARFSVRRRDPREATGVTSTEASFDDALARAFSTREAPRLDPPVGPARARPASSAPAPAKPAAPAPAEEDAVLAARTLVLGPERPGAAQDDLDEEQVLAARTMVVVDDRPPLDDEEEVLAAHTLVLKGGEAGPQGRTDRRWSKVLDRGRLVGWIAPDTETAWSIYDEQGRKTAVVAADEGRARVCWLGDKATESFEYFEAPTPLEAIAVAYELTGPPAIEPPIAGL
ncbi:MAG: hypothetical protein M9894_26610 [Planctomycetes bacterium]|nr:hypothetical protein [Planctomycetota bacterium]